MQTNFKMSAKSRIGVLLLTLLGLVTLTSAASNKASTFGAIFNFGKGMFTLAKDQHVVGNKLEAERIRLKRENEDLRKALCEKERALKTQDAEIQRLNALQNLWKNAGKTVKDSEIKTLTEIVRNTSLQNEKLTGQIGKLKIEHNKLKQEKSVRMQAISGLRMIFQCSGTVFGMLLPKVRRLHDNIVKRNQQTLQMPYLQGSLRSLTRSV